MDSITETAFLTIMEEKSYILTTKGKTKELREKRSEAWEWVSRQLLVKTGKDFTSIQLQKKWNNNQQRLKDKTTDGKKTGGGPAVRLSDNDKLTWKILGDTNPKVTMVPGAMANTSSCSLASTISEDENEPEMKSPVMKKIKRDVVAPCTSAELNLLHREVLLLQKEKLLLRIKCLQREVIEQKSIGTQTEVFSFVNMLNN